jgi:predicted 3-demethylubiquinone-9 3-methyltransferase (glyoxalase superfamily)
MQQTITPHLWFDKEAREAGELYTSVFPDSTITDISTLRDTPSGSVDIVTIELAGQEFTLLSAGPLFKFTPAVSFLVSCATTEEVDDLWRKLSKGGSVLMELGEYPFSKRYGWFQDRYGLSWQVMHAGDRAIRQKITPTLMFVGDVCGKAEEAIHHYVSIFGNSPSPAHSARGKSGEGDILRYGKGEEPDKEGTVKYGAFTLLGQEFAAMDSARTHDFRFNEAISLIVHCDTQEEIDYYWAKLSADPKAEQCGWLKDKFGVSWQVVPTAMDEMLRDKDEKKLARVTEAFLKMKKFDIAELQEAYEGEKARVGS